MLLLVKMYCLQPVVKMAEKYYFKSNKLNNTEKEMILNITNKDSTTKFVCDYYYNNKNLTVEELSFMYNEIKNYTNKIFPIAEFNILSGDIWSYQAILYRAEILRIMKSLPSVAFQNSTDKNITRNNREMLNLLDKLKDFYKSYQKIKPSDLERLNKRMFFSHSSVDYWMGILKNETSSKTTDFNIDNILSYTR